MRVQSLRLSENVQFTISVTVAVCRKLPDAPVIVNVYVPAGVPLLPLRAVVVTFMLDVACPLPGFGEPGENEQLEEAGSPEQLSETEPNVPPSACTATV
jgi:hypothetical protein